MKIKKILTCALAVFAACSISLTTAGEMFESAVITESVSREYLSLGGETVKNGLLFTELEDGTYEVGYNYNGAKPTGAVVIPETVNGKRVTRIAEAGFYGCGELSGVTVPDSVTSAGANAFTGTKFLNSQSGTVKYAGKIAVYCSGTAKSVTVKDGTLGLADKLFTTSTALEKIVLPESLVNLGNMTFMGCDKLSSVNIPGKVKTIGSGVFNGCAALKSVSIPESVTAIGSYAFAQSGITSANIPNVTKIGKGAFEDSSLGMGNLTVGSGYIDIGGRAFAGTYYYAALGTEKYVGTVFVGCDDNTTSVDIKSGTTAIAGMAFSGKKKLRSVTIPDSVKTIGDDAFFNCTQLSSAITIPEGVESIGGDAFRLCGNLTSVSLPMSLKSVGAGAFYGCDKLKTVTYPGSVTDWGKISAGDDEAMPAVSSFGKSPKAPDPITGLKVTETTGSTATLTWKKSSLANKYQIDVYKNGKWYTAGKTYGDTTEFTVTGLSQLTEYDFRVYAFTHNTYSSPVSVKGKTKVASVSGVKTTPYTTSVLISWNKNDKADSYQIDMYKNGKWVALLKTKNGSAVSCTISDLSPKTEYQFRIFAFVGSEYSASTKFTVTTPERDKPTPVTGLSASPSGNSVALSWNKSPTADSYQIDMYKDGKWVYLAKTSATSYTAGGLSANTSYQFRVFAFNGSVYSSSVSISAKTGAASAASGKPSAVTGLSAAPSTNSVKLSWDKNSSADSYQIDVYKNGSWTYVTKTTGTSYTVSGLSKNTSYQFRIFAFKGSQYSSSVKIDAKTGSSGSTSSGASSSTSGKPSAVTGLSAAPSTNSVKLSWNKNSSADSYQIDVYKGGKWVYVTKTTGTSYTVSGLSKNTSYQFRVFAFKGSQYSSSVKIDTKTGSSGGTSSSTSGKPSAVTGLSASPSTSSVKLSWDKNSSADSYQIDMYKGGKWVYVTKTTGTSYTVSGLSKNTSYQFRVFAFKGSQYSSSVKIDASTGTPAKPSAVTGLSASTSANSITLSWNKNSSADSYQIDMYKNGKWTYVAKITGTSYTVSGLSNNTSYQFRVFAFKGSQYSSSVGIGVATKKLLASPEAYAAAAAVSPTELSSANTLLKGIDVSGWQGVIDFNAVKESGVDFVIVKAGERNSTVDTWETNYANAKRAGLMVGSYWYSRATTLDDAQREANAFITALKGKIFEFPVYFDMEESAQFDQGKTFCTNLVDTFCGALEKAGYCAGVYCSTYWFTNFVTDDMRLKYPVWMADYRGKCYYDGSYGMWQYGISNNVAGIDGNCDVDWGYIDYSRYIKTNKLNGITYQ